MAKQTSKGTCHYCKESFSKAGIRRHLAACKSRQAVIEEAAAKSSAKMAKLLHLHIYGTSLPHYWLHLEVPASTTLTVLDNFLRDIWLECCGHLSAFTISKQRYSSYPDPDDWFGLDEKSTDIAIGTVLKSGMKIDYEYDFGTTTDLTVRVVAERQGVAKKNSVVAMARNDPLEVLCSVCEKNLATNVCAVCWGYEGWVCDKCAPAHECGEEMLLPVVNSPRVGQCAYTGQAW